MFIHPSGSAASGPSYPINNSLRIRSGASAHLTRTLTSASNRRTYTFSAWVKRGTLGNDQWLFGADDGIIYSDFMFTSDYLAFRHIPNTSGLFYRWRTPGVFRDPSAWYHLVLAIDTTQATGANRNRIYVNGVEQTGLVDTGGGGGGFIPQNTDTIINSNVSHSIGRFVRGGTTNVDGYLAEVYFIDGQALTPNDFGLTDTNGNWQPKAYAGTYGSQGWYLKFDNATSLTTLAEDRSGNGNHWTATNVSLTAGATYDWMLDTPTNNFAVLNPLPTTRSTLSNGNLTASGATDLPTIIPASGTWYFERGGAAQTWTPPAAFPAGAGDYNFGQRPFAGTPTNPTLCTANLPAPAINDPRKHFDIRTRTGTGASANITGLQFQPDLVWIKSRGRALDHALFDSARGVQKMLESNQTGAETTETTGLTAFNADGYTIGALDQINGTAAVNSFVDWAWKAGGVAVANNAGSISSQVSVNAAAGISIVTYTGTGANATVGHGLGSAPLVVLVKRRGSAGGWAMYHSALIGVSPVVTSPLIYLNSNNSGIEDPSAFGNAQPPTTSVFTVGTNADVNASGGDYVAYCFSPIRGFSFFSRYLGNGVADGPFVYCGFRPRWLLVKQSQLPGTSWVLLDAQRSPQNVAGAVVFPDLPQAENAVPSIDFTANGFKVRTTDLRVNQSTYWHAFMAFAEAPLKLARAR